MLDRLYHRLSSRSGFTLVELLVVLIVISVLLGFTTVRVTSAIDSARVASEKAMVRNAFTVAQSNYADNDQSYDGGVIATEIAAIGGDYVGTTEHTAANSFEPTDLAAGVVELAVGDVKADVVTDGDHDGAGEYLLILLDSDQNTQVYCYEDNVGTVNSGTYAGTTCS